MVPVAAALLFFQSAAAPASEGIKALDEGRYEAAAQIFQKAIAADPADYTAHFNLALAYGFLQRDAEGIQEYRKVLELKPGLYEAQLNEGILLLRQKRAAEAAPLLEAAAAQKPKEFRPRFYLGEAQLAAGQPGPAAESYRAAVELDAKSAAAQLGLGRALALEGKLADATLSFQRAAALDGAYRGALVELGALYEKAGQKTEAMEIYRQFPDDPGAQEHLAQLLLESKQYSDAVLAFERAYNQSPSAANRLGLAMAYLFTQQADKALPLLERAVADDGTNFDLRIVYAHALRDRKQYHAAADQFSAAVKLKPQDAHTWDELGGVLYLAEEYQPALAAFERAHQLGENTAGNWFLQAIILDKGHQLKPALEAYRQFLALSGGKNPDQEWQARQRQRILEKELDRR
ncbi:MAG: tetratricopeptide repeat protein [Acidobacteriia bacterium]|nr:tetratricopeptide repeat protein [Terriglobia bacterium]